MARAKAGQHRAALHFRPHVCVEFKMLLLGVGTGWFRSQAAHLVRQQGNHQHAVITIVSEVSTHCLIRNRTKTLSLDSVEHGLA